MAIYTEEKAEKLLSKYIPVAKSVMTKTPIDGIAATRKIKLPVVLKLISSKALHKTEVNGVRIVKDLDELRAAYGDFYKTCKKKKIPFDGVLMQEFIKGEEVIIGINKDPTFGHVIAFGTGGKYVEILKDIAFRSCPITLKDAQDMIDEIKMRKLLYGFRGSKPVNINLLKKTLVAVSQIPKKYKGIEELDINPFIINDKIGKVADARIITK